MTDSLITLPSTAVFMAALALISIVSLKGWRDWIALKRFELESFAGGQPAPSEPASTRDAASRIDLADLRERVRKLEAIAAGVDL